MAIYLAFDQEPSRPLERLDACLRGTVPRSRQHQLLQGLAQRVIQRIGSQHTDERSDVAASRHRKSGDEGFREGGWR